MTLTPLFISTDYILKYYKGYIEPNMDSDSLDTFIVAAQDIKLVDVLGSKLYQKYINDINTYDSPQGAAYIYLMDNYIQKSLALWTIYKAMNAFDSKITNKGIVNKTSDNSETISDSRLQRKMNDIMNDAQTYDNRIADYILNNPTSFPEYFNQEFPNSVKPKQQTYFCGVYIPKNNCNKNCRY
jgi:hypothetical protein